MGVFIRKNGVVSIQVASGIKITHKGKIVKEMQLQNDHSGEPTVLKYNTLSWYVIKRGENLLIRLKDSTNARIANFKGIDYFPISADWRIKAKFEAYDTVKYIPIPTALGNVIDEPCPGALAFTIAGKDFRLDPIAETSDEDFFLIFSDETNGRLTYGSGRFLSVAKPDRDGFTIIDFNKAYNPPCAFSEFATCPFPPKQNHISIEVTAGEKDYGHLHQ